MNIPPGTDLRKPEYRRELFLRFYEWSLRHQSFPGGVHYALPHISRELGLDGEQRAWLAFLNGNTQNPVTSLLLLQAAPRPELAENAIVFWNMNYRALQWDTDRRYHKAKFGEAAGAYAEMGPGMWGEKAWQGRDWDSCWRLARTVPYMGRLSAWSYLEYLRILGLGVPDADTLLLDDISGSRSHRNGLCLVSGRDEWISDKQLGTRDPNIDYTPDMLSRLEAEGWALLAEAAIRLADYRPLTSMTVGNLSLESALCTFKSWHKRNRRYPGVYNDMLHDRIRHGEIHFGHRFGVLWDARREALPARLRLEDNPLDPGCAPVKQNWFLDHGQVVNMSAEWPELRNGFESAVERGEFGRRPVRWI